MTQVTAYVALGSNLGDREAILRDALDAIGCIERTKVTRVSDIIETPPMGQPGQRDYLNAVAALHTEMSPRELLEQFLEIEAAHGRTRSEQSRWGSRVLDIDLLLYGEQVIDEPGLTVPHPHMHERLFVLQPLSQIAPDVMHPVLGKPVHVLLEDLKACRHGGMKA